MSSPTPTQKRVQDVVPATVVSSDPISQEQILSNQVQQIQLQSSTDSHYDTVISRFSDINSMHSGSSLLLCLSVAAGLLILSYSIVKRR